MKTTFCKIYWALFEEFDLSPVEGLLLMLLYGLSRRKGYCYASKKTLAEHLNVSDICIYDVLKRLEDQDLIRRVGKTSSNTMGIEVDSAVYDFIQEQDVSQNEPKGS